MSDTVVWRTSCDSPLKGVAVESEKYDTPLVVLSTDPSLDFVCVDREIAGFVPGDDGWWMFPRTADFMQLHSPLETKITKSLGSFYQWIRPTDAGVRRCTHFYLSIQLRNDPAFDRQQLESVLWNGKCKL